MILLAVALAAQAPAGEAEALGLRLAQSGTLAALAPAIMSKETEELLAEHPEFDAATKDRLRVTAKNVARADMDRLDAALAKEYTAKLSLADLRALVAFEESAAAHRFRAVVPGALAGAMRAIGQLDYKGDVRAAFCRETGKACPAK